MSRFIKTTAEAIGEEPDERYQWWLDTSRLVKGEDRFNQKYIAVQTESGKDPNNFIRHDRLNLLFTDQAEYYAVCNDCYSAHSSSQWSGHTRNSDWRESSERFLKKHTEQKGWCQFCDPIFGNGGWSD